MKRLFNKVSICMMMLSGVVLSLAAVGADTVPRLIYFAVGAVLSLLGCTIGAIAFHLFTNRHEADQHARRVSAIASGLISSVLWTAFALILAKVTDPGYPGDPSGTLSVFLVLLVVGIPLVVSSIITGYGAGTARAETT